MALGLSKVEMTSVRHFCLAILSFWDDINPEIHLVWRISD
jgi:hypothetical protein